MGNTSVSKKLKNIIAAFIALCVVSMQLGFASIVFAADSSNLDVNAVFTSEKNNEGTEETVHLDVTTLVDGTQINSIELPNGELVTGATADYHTNENGILTFKVNYVVNAVKTENGTSLLSNQSDSEPKQIIQTFEVTGLKENQSADQLSPQLNNENMLNDVKEDITPPDNAFTIDRHGVITAYNSKIGGTDNIVIPNTINGITVKQIGNQAFQGKGLTGSITIPDGVNIISNNAFANNQLTNIRIPNSVTAIGKGAFNNNSLLALQLSTQTQKLLNKNPIMNNQTMKSLPYTYNEKTQTYTIDASGFIDPSVQDNIADPLTFSWGTLKYAKGIFTFKPTFPDWFDINELNISYDFKIFYGESLKNYQRNSVSISNFVPAPKPQHQVTFNTQGGNTLAPVSVQAGNLLPQDATTTPTHPKGYAFAGWFKDADCTDPWTMNSDTVQQPITLYAKWEWDDQVQQPAMLVSIPKTVEMYNYDKEGVARGTGTISVRQDDPTEQRWYPNRNIVITTNPEFILTCDGGSDTFALDIYKSDSSKYTNGALMTLNANTGAEKALSDTFTLQTSIDRTKAIGSYKGTMTFTIQFEDSKE